MKLYVRASAFCVLWAAAVFAQDDRVVTFETSDGVAIEADYYAPPKDNSPVVFLLHMYQSDRSAWSPLVPKLRRAGFAVIAIDLRGHGRSVHPTAMNLSRRAKDRDEKLFNAMHLDVAAAYAFMAGQRGVDLTRIAIVGASVGCSVAIDYAARDPSVDVVVCMTPGERYLGVDSTRHIERYGDRPILLLATEDERAASDRLGSINSVATVDVVGTGRVHGTRMFGEIEGIEDRIVSFLREHIEPIVEGRVVARMGSDRYYALGSKEHIEMPPDEVRWFSSVKEARARGLTGADSHIDGTMDDSELPSGMP